MITFWVSSKSSMVDQISGILAADRNIQTHAHVTTCPSCFFLVGTLHRLPFILQSILFPNPKTNHPNTYLTLSFRGKKKSKRSSGSFEKQVDRKVSVADNGFACECVWKQFGNTFWTIYQKKTTLWGPSAPHGMGTKAWSPRVQMLILGGGYI